MNLNPFKRDRDLVDIFHLLVTLAIAVGGFLINQKQAELNRKLEREQATQVFADKVFEHVESLNLDEKDEEAMVIDLLDIITESNISKTGELSDTDRRLLMPLRIALVTGNAEILSHIGADKSKRELWVKFAKHSGSAKVKLTAIQALENLGRYGGKEGQNSDLLFSIDRILTLSRDLSSLENILITTQALVRLVDIMDYETMRFIISSSKNDSMIVAKIYEFLFEQRSNLELAKNSAESQIKNSLQAIVDNTDEATDKLADLLDFKIEEATMTKTKSIDELAVSYADQIDQLNSNISDKRASARIKLASLGENAVKPLVASLRNDNLTDSYTLRLGVAKALSLMKQPVAIHDPDDVSSIVDLIGDSRKDIRLIASEFLMKLTDQTTVDLVYAELKERIQEKSNGNEVYNAAVILGTWLRVLPTDRPPKAELKTYLEKMKTDLGKEPGRWTRTIAVINELLGKVEVR